MSKLIDYIKNIPYRRIWNAFYLRLKSIWKAMQFQPLWRTLAELFFSVTFTFLPFLLLSIPLAQSKGALEFSSVGSKFWSYFNSGEIALPILSLCGAIAAIAFTRHRALNDVLVFIASAASILVAMVASYAIGVSEEFGQVLYPLITWAGFGAYAALLVLWGVLGHSASKEKDTENPEKRVDDILDEAHRRRQEETA